MNSIWNMDLFCEGQIQKINQSAVSHQHKIRDSSVSQLQPQIHTVQSVSETIVAVTLIKRTREICLD